MAQLYFHCCNDSDRRVLLDRSPTEFDDLGEACEHAERLVHTLLSVPSMEDWRHWAVHVSDDFDDEVFVVPFSSLIGKLN